MQKNGVKNPNDAKKCCILTLFSVLKVTYAHQAPFADIDGCLRDGAYMLIRRSAGRVLKFTQYGFCMVRPIFDF